MWSTKYMKLTKGNIMIGDVSNYQEDLAFSPRKVSFYCTHVINDFDGLFNLHYPDGHIMAISIQSQIADGVVRHIIAREVLQESNDSGAE